jgi:two-component system LytT family response regulator
VVDDELLARRRLSRLLHALPDVVVAGELEEAGAALAAIRKGDIDVVLLDIAMPGLSGLDALRLIPAERAPHVIFCTAHPVHAVEAFDAGAVDYILKPIEPARLLKALERARARRAPVPPAPSAAAPAAATPPAPAPAPAPAALDRLAVETRKGIVLLDPRKVTHAVLENELVTLHTSDGEAYLCDVTLQDLWERLPRDCFERVHRRAVINLEQVQRLEPIETGGYLARMPGGQTVEVSRQAARELRRRLGLR